MRIRKEEGQTPKKVAQPVLRRFWYLLVVAPLLPGLLAAFSCNDDSDSQIPDIVHKKTSKMKTFIPCYGEKLWTWTYNNDRGPELGTEYFNHWDTTRPWYRSLEQEEFGPLVMPAIDFGHALFVSRAIQGVRFITSYANMWSPDEFCINVNPDEYGSWPSEQCWSPDDEYGNYTCPDAPCDEMKDVGPWQGSGPLSLTVTNWQGVGQFRLFVMAAQSNQPEQSFDYNVCLMDFTPGTQDKATLRKLLWRTSARLLGAFEGQKIVLSWNVYTGSCSGDRIEIYKYDDCPCASCGAVACYDWFNDEIEVRASSGTDGYGYNKNLTYTGIDRLARILVHEIGHYHDADDEYDEAAPGCCGHSLMSDVENRGLEFCIWPAHNLDGYDTDCGNSDDDDAWSQITDETGITMPNHSYHDESPGQSYPDPEWLVSIPSNNYYPINRIVNVNFM